MDLDPSTSCLAAIYYQDAASIELRCKVSTEPAKFTLERLNGTSFVSVAQQETTAQIQCSNRRSVHQLLGTQISTLKHSCSIMAGHPAMACNREHPEDMTFFFSKYELSQCHSQSAWRTGATTSSLPR